MAMYQPEPAGHTKPCDCKERHQASRDGTFLYNHNLEGWVFTDAPLRSASPLAIYYADGRGTHDGEPFRWSDCPWCGRELHPPTPDVTWKLLTGDGDE